jgi:hypothetical protein
LPGPAIWWPEDNKDIDATGFFFSDQKTGHMEAMALVMAEGVHADEMYERVFPSYDDLRVMDDDSMTRMALKAFFSLRK